MGLNRLHVPSSPRLLGYETRDYYKMNVESKSEAIASVIIFWSLYEYPIHHQREKKKFSLNGHIGPPPLYQVLRLE